MPIYCLGLAIISSQVQAADTLHPSGPYTQPPTGMIFPTDVGDFHRVDVVRYKPDESDESAGYNRITPFAEIAATVYVFPSPHLWSFGSPQNVIDDARSHLCDQQFEGIKREVMSAHPDAKLINEAQTTLDQEGKAQVGHKAIYVLNNPHFFGRSNVASQSEAYSFCFAGGKWTIEYRFDYPSGYDADHAIGDFMRGLVWTIPPEH